MGLFRTYAKYKMGKKIFDTVMRKVRGNGRSKGKAKGRRRSLLG